MEEYLTCQSRCGSQETGTHCRCIVRIVSAAQSQSAASTHALTANSLARVPNTREPSPAGIAAWACAAVSGVSA